MNDFAYILNGQLLETCQASHFWSFFLKLGFTPCKAEQSLWDMDLQEKEEKKGERHVGKLFRKNLQIKDVS